MWSAWRDRRGSARADWSVRRWRSRKVAAWRFSAFCESHTREIPFHVAARLLRDAAGITDLDEEAARARAQVQVPDADPEDVVLLDDLLGIRDPDVALPDIDPDARRRRLSALINSDVAGPHRTSPVHHRRRALDRRGQRVDGPDFLTVIPQTQSTVLITYRPEYRGTLTHVPGGADDCAGTVD